MSEDKRFTDDGIEDIENQSFTDNLIGKTYWIDNGLDEIVDLLNSFNEENKHLKQFKEKVFSLLDKEITENEEAIEWGEKQGVGVGAMGFHTSMLKILRKELQE